MRIAFAQMKIDSDAKKNLDKTLRYMDEAKKEGADLIFFPEVQLSPFFPQFENRDVSQYVIREHDDCLEQIANKSKELELYSSPNVYLEKEGKKYDASLMIDRNGDLMGISKMVHVFQGEQFYEQDYYTPSDTGFQVYETDFGKVGIVICFDRHLPESIRTCALKGAELIIIPTANTKGENLEMFEWEIRVQAMQNNVFIAMCNRVGKEDNMDFAGESLLVDPNGNLLVKTNDLESLSVVEIDLSMVHQIRKKRPFINLRRTNSYK
jgi:predicted amidohydrolase